MTAMTAAMRCALDEAEALTLWRRACGRDGAAERGLLAENFQPVIEAEAARLAGEFPADQLVWWGNLGLLRAFCCYRPDSPVGLYEHCRRRVCETMMDAERAAAAAPGGGIDCAAEVARLWGELSREFGALQVSVG